MGSGNMAGETRNQGLVGMSDGIPLFKDKNVRSVIPVMLRTANMGDHLSMKFRYTHMTGLVPCHFWILGEESKLFERVERKPSHLMAILHAITDDLLIWEDGQYVEDHSKCAQGPERWFRLRVALLYWCSDYPGQGEASGFSHSASGKKACHWCEVIGRRSVSIDRQKYENYYRCVQLSRILSYIYIYLKIFLQLPTILHIFAKLLGYYCNYSQFSIYWHNS